MLRDRLKSLFQRYEPAVKQVIYEVGDLEQQYISMKTPRGIMNDIDEIISRIAKEEMERLGSDEE